MNLTFASVYDMPIVQNILRKAEKEIFDTVGIKMNVVLESIDKIGDSNEIKTEILKQCICKIYAIKWSEIISSDRSRRAVDARHAYMYLAYSMLNHTFKIAGLQCGGKDHTTAVFAVSKIKGFYDVNDSNIIKIEKVKELFNNEYKAL